MKLSNHIDKVVGTLNVPGDKSITHRSIMFGALAKGKTFVSNVLFGEDCLHTIQVFKQLGVEIEEQTNGLTINGKGFSGLTEPKSILYTGNSGTTTRLLLGILAGTPFYSVVSGDESLNKRPMSRVTIPLEQMGAQFWGRDNNEKLPISVRGGELHGIEYTMPVASAQVKSAIIFAALNAEGKTVITERVQSRNHTELMLERFSGDIFYDNNKIIIPGHQQLEGTKLTVPGDISSAAFFITLGLVMKNSEIILNNVGLNKTRTGFLEKIEKMNGKIEYIDIKNEGSETFGTIRITPSELTGTIVEGELIPRLIDEIPILALLATQAEGKTIIKDAHELKLKETNRIDTVVEELRKLGAMIEATEDGMIIYGRTKLKGGVVVDSHGDHRIGMMLAIASFLCEDEILLKNAECIKVSYPNFFDDLKKLI